MLPSFRAAPVSFSYLHTYYPPNPNRSLEFELISMFMVSRLIRHFPEGIAGYVEEKCGFRYRQKLESSQIIY